MVKRTLKEFIFIIVREGNYKIARATDKFRELPQAHQDGLVSFIHEQVGDEAWGKWVGDKYSYGEFLSAVIVNFSGEAKWDQPTFDDLARLIGEYLKSSEFHRSEEAEDEVETTFLDELEEL